VAQGNAHMGLWCIIYIGELYMRGGDNQVVILGITGQQDQLNICVHANYRRYVSMLNPPPPPNLDGMKIS
jgi:hypothetical protein